MRIVDKRTHTTVPFKDIKAGECFIDEEDELNIKIDVSYYNADEKNGPNAIVLDSGQPWSCNDEYQVVKVRAGVIIEA